MRFIPFVTASPLLAFEMKVPCQASPASMSRVRCGARARNAATCPASWAMPPARKLELAFALCTKSASRWPWMSSVCSSWIRSSASVADVGVGATDGEQAAATARSSARRERSTEAMLTSSDAALALGGDARVLRRADERHDIASALHRYDPVRGGRYPLADADRESVTDARADGSRGVRSVTAAAGRRRHDGHGLLCRRGLHREPRHGAVHAARQPRGPAARERRL